MAVRSPAVAQRANAPARAEAAELPDELAVENGINVWPDEASEAAFLSEQNASPERGAPAAEARAQAKEEPEEAKAPLPRLDELVKRISPEARELLDDLFRAKFVSVRRVPKQALKG